MTSTLNNKKKFLIFTVILTSVFLLWPFSSKAQSSLSLSVTPTLFEMSANAGQFWQSSIKVINSNKFDLTVYARVVNFAPQGETGQGKLLPVLNSEADGSTLAEWFDIDTKPITIPREQSKSIPFTVQVPDNVTPGGHFAAIMISTEPPPQTGNLSVRTAQIVTSLFFVRIAGDVKENGDIRSFTTEKTLVQKPENTFILRFENKGNVYLQPRGDIRIYNMWGKERGVIPINEKTHFGNVLPASIRKFNFSWTGEQSITDIGRYKAIATLAYGLGNTQFVTSSTYFWVIPIKALAITLGSFLLLLLSITWIIKLYIRRMLLLAGVPVEGVQHREKQSHNKDIKLHSYKTVTAPMSSGYRDLKSRLENVSALGGIFKELILFVKVYKFFFLGVIIILTAIFATYYYFSDVTVNKKSYNVTISNTDLDINLSSEEILYQELAKNSNLPQLGAMPQQDFALVIENTSAVAGTAAKTAADLVKTGYAVSSISTREDRVNKRTIIVFDKVVQDSAVTLSKKLGGALLSARTGSSSTSTANITIFVGTDRLK